MLKAGDEVPHFRVTTVEGRQVRYDDMWQRKNLVLIAIPEDATSDADRVSGWAAAAKGTAGDDTDWVITRNEVPGMGRFGVVVADKWGEIHFAAEGRGFGELPGGDELIEWLEYVRHQCPECQGEAR